MDVTIARFQYRDAAELAHDCLKSAGIPSVLTATNPAGVEAEVSHENPGRLVVKKEDRARAREALVRARILGN
jgi:hypothetical protein